ncbi:hydroxymethylglutaryl-CoA lyase [Testudinibacter sp. TR-2022]|uniref:hydroxymethylglutaryl-CoA lyase n=1 Tax=Testudinibacter sp. TR-2022 TaxID=2585029 RepID=UPI00111AB1A8|nr:hydroxymethylglutaryl-CoA lyase [Testudinibacter sp. TR-2022]TNH07247.1 hydroxymethylglutaryl-CoA lyase [Pasteurellaceae bacterium Phil11]TNH21117.1 hydroxymethylglutaryl-CoA lyase [Testudinibacter sp. TR-2022]TNH27788.1 hydroxymethylglutaryl-CoA lyase [Testudinibacter sp. TR-2022]
MQSAVEHSNQTVFIREVCPRDGFQNVAVWIETEDKKRIITSLLQSGIRSIEATSFVSPKAIPQMRDATEIATFTLEKAKSKGIDVVALVPNLKGMELAYAAGIREVNYVVSVSEAHNKANINRTPQQSLQELKNIVQQYPDVKIHLVLATVFGCPFNGETPFESIKALISSAVQECGIKAVTLCDTIGVANPAQVRSILADLISAYPQICFTLHLHNTHGMALANIAVALDCGIRHFETAAGGLGGCPFAPGAAGNSATEDLVNMLQRMGFKTDVELPALLSAVKLIDELIPNAVSSQLSRARTYQEFDFFPMKEC